MGRFEDIIPYLRYAGFVAQEVTFPQLLNVSYMVNHFDVLLCLGQYLEPQKSEISKFSASNTTTSSLVNSTYLKAIVDFAKYGKGVWVENLFAYYDKGKYSNLWEGLLGIRWVEGNWGNIDHTYSADIFQANNKIDDVSIVMVSRGMSSSFCAKSTNGIYASLQGARSLISDHNVATWYVNSTYGSRGIMFGFPLISECDNNVLNSNATIRNNNMIFIKNAIMWLGKADNAVQARFPAHFDIATGKEYNQTFIYTRHDYLVLGGGEKTDDGYLSNKTIWETPIPVTALLVEAGQFDSPLAYSYYKNVLENYLIEVASHTKDHVASTYNTTFNIEQFCGWQDDYQRIFGYNTVGICPPGFTQIDKNTTEILRTDYGVYYILNHGDDGVASYYGNLVSLPCEEIWDEGGGIWNLKTSNWISSLVKDNRLFALTLMMIHPEAVLNAYSNITNFFYYLTHDYPYRDQVWFTTASKSAYLWKAILGLYSEGSQVEGTFDGLTYTINITVGSAPYVINGLPLTISDGIISSAKINGEPIYSFFNKTVVLYNLEPGKKYSLSIKIGTCYTPQIEGLTNVINDVQIPDNETVSSTWNTDNLELSSEIRGAVGSNISVRYYIPSIFDSNFIVDCNQRLWGKSFDASNGILTVWAVIDSDCQVRFQLTRLAGTVRLSVKQADGTPIANAKVISAIQPYDQEQLVGITDSSGILIFQDVYTSYGSGYSFVVMKEGYENVQTQTAVTKGATVNITLILSSIENTGVEGMSPYLWLLVIPPAYVSFYMASKGFTKNRRTSGGT